MKNRSFQQSSFVYPITSPWAPYLTSSRSKFQSQWFCDSDLMPQRIDSAILVRRTRLALPHRITNFRQLRQEYLFIFRNQSPFLAFSWCESSVKASQDCSIIFLFALCQAEATEISNIHEQKWIYFFVRFRAQISSLYYVGNGRESSNINNFHHTHIIVFAFQFPRSLFKFSSSFCNTQVAFLNVEISFRISVNQEKFFISNLELVSSILFPEFKGFYNHKDLL